jgi:hypothetical protein
VKHAVLGALALVALVATVAYADTARSVSYPYERVWPAAVRFLRVDLKLKIIEKDADAGYVLFELAEDRKTFQGSLQLSRAKDPDRREATRLALKIAGRPSYVEDELLVKLERKLKEELGDPAPAPAPAPPAAPAPAPDAGPKPH